MERLESSKVKKHKIMLRNIEIAKGIKEKKAMLKLQMNNEQQQVFTLNF